MFRCARLSEESRQPYAAGLPTPSTTFAKHQTTHAIHYFPKMTRIFAVPTTNIITKPFCPDFRAHGRHNGHHARRSPNCLRCKRSTRRLACSVAATCTGTCRGQRSESLGTQLAGRVNSRPRAPMHLPHSIKTVLKIHVEHIHDSLLPAYDLMAGIICPTTVLR